MMTTPLQRLSRMLKSFKKDRSVLVADYKYFITPAAPVMPHASTPQNTIVRKSGARSVPKSPKQS
jgi:hypothetical protein